MALNSCCAVRIMAPHLYSIYSFFFQAIINSFIFIIFSWFKSTEPFNCFSHYRFHFICIYIFLFYCSHCLSSWRSRMINVLSVSINWILWFKRSSILDCAQFLFYSNHEAVDDEFVSWWKQKWNCLATNWVKL